MSRNEIERKIDEIMESRDPSDFDLSFFDWRQARKCAEFVDQQLRLGKVVWHYEQGSDDYIIISGPSTVQEAMRYLETVGPWRKAIEDGYMEPLSPEDEKYFTRLYSGIDIYEL